MRTPEVRQVYLLASRRRHTDERTMLAQAMTAADGPALPSIPAYANSVYTGNFVRICSRTELKSQMMVWGNYGALMFNLLQKTTDLEQFFQQTQHSANLGLFALKDDVGTLESLHVLYPAFPAGPTKLLLQFIQAPWNILSQEFVEITGKTSPYCLLDRTLYVELAVLVHAIRAFVQEEEMEKSRNVVQLNLGIAFPGTDFASFLVREHFLEGLFFDCFSLLQQRFNLLDRKLESLGVLDSKIFNVPGDWPVSVCGLTLDLADITELFIDYNEQVEAILGIIAAAKTKH